MQADLAAQDGAIGAPVVSRPRLFTPEQRAAIAREIGELGMKPDAVAVAHGIHRSTANLWAHQHGYEPTRRGPGAPWRKRPTTTETTNAPE